VTKIKIEEAASTLISLGTKRAVVIRSGPLGAFTLQRDHPGQWVEAYWTSNDVNKVVDVTGAGNAFLGGLAAGLALTNGNIFQGSSKR
jgi:sugar/nucleoside kinase (ribokinase family)